MMKLKSNASEFKNLNEIEYFQFEEDFMEDNVRCIPMIVRLKMDEVGIKLKLSAWSKFQPDERVELAILPIATGHDRKHYRQFLTNLIRRYTGIEALNLPTDPSPAWQNVNIIPAMLIEKSAEFQLNISLYQWRNLTPLQRFALLKLCRPGHENKNFCKAVAEFHLLID